jgi:hypothetical protein
MCYAERAYVAVSNIDLSEPAYFVAAFRRAKDSQTRLRPPRASQVITEPASRAGAIPRRQATAEAFRRRSAKD